MLDNLYVKLKLKFEYRDNYMAKDILNIGLHDCTETTFVKKIYESETDYSR